MSHSKNNLLISTNIFKVPLIWSLKTKSMETSETYLSEHVRTTIDFSMFLVVFATSTLWAGKVLQPLL